MDNSSRGFNQIKAQAIVPKENLQVLPEGINRILPRVAKSRIAKEKKAVPLFTCRLCKITPTGIFQLRQRTGGKNISHENIATNANEKTAIVPLASDSFPRRTI